MKDFVDKVAVVTGAASGIGRAIAERCAQERMKIVLADIEEAALVETEREMTASGAKVLAVLTDVSSYRDVEALADKALEAFGAVHLLCNCAGVGGGTSIWESTINDWKWVLGSNLWGVIHGVHAFLPTMLRQDTEGHIVNTSSIAGMTAGPGMGIYRVTKHGVVALSETLHYELEQRHAKVKVSVLCPGFVKTRIVDAERNRPPDLRNDPAEVITSPEHDALMQAVRQAVEGGIPASTVADQVFRAVREERL
jgi:NAD(P)-dependent dehydrogenase (short-subunit alcohol dehydrogenase family)